MQRAIIAVTLAGLLMLGAVAFLPPIVGAQRSLRPGQPAPEIIGEPWINSEPLTIEKLSGRVVLVEFWTYG